MANRRTPMQKHATPAQLKTEDPTTMKPLLTDGGYPLLECASALQKTIRRGLTEEAMFWAAEIETRFPDYLWTRLTAILNEDISLASPETILLFETFRNQYRLLREKSKGTSERMVLANAILAMCRAKKTRLGDDFQTVIYRRRIQEGWRLEVPDFALDRHTARGRHMGRDYTHWHDEGLKLVNETPGLNPYAAEARRLREKHGPMPKTDKTRTRSGRGKGQGDTPDLFTGDEDE